MAEINGKVFIPYSLIKPGDAVLFWRACYEKSHAMIEDLRNDLRELDLLLEEIEELDHE